MINIMHIFIKHQIVKIVQLNAKIIIIIIIKIFNTVHKIIVVITFKTKIILI